MSPAAPRHGPSRSAGTTLATSQTRNLLFGTDIIDTFQVDLQNTLFGKSCIAPAKSITVGRLDSLTWVDQTNPNNPKVNPHVVQGKRALLVFTVTFSPATPLTKENVGFFVEVFEDIDGRVINPAGVVINLTEDVAAGEASSRVFRADIDNQTNDFRYVIGNATIRGTVQKVTPSIQFNPF